MVLLTKWKDDDWLQRVAAEFNLSETAYIVKTDETSSNKVGNVQKVDSKDDFDTPGEPENVIHEYDLRWFTPAAEVRIDFKAFFHSTAPAQGPKADSTLRVVVSHDIDSARRFKFLSVYNVCPITNFTASSIIAYMIMYTCLIEE